MVEAAVRWVLLKTAVYGPAVITDRHGFEDLVQEEINNGGDSQAYEVGVVAKQNTDDKNKYPQSWVKIFLNIEADAVAKDATIDLAALLATVAERYVDFVGAIRAGGFGNF